MPIVDDLSVEVEGPLMAALRPTTEHRRRLGCVSHAKGMDRPFTAVRGIVGECPSSNS
jgi:hypothetical protein